MKKKDENDKQKEFINLTLLKLKDDINKFIVDTNYSNIQSLYLRQQIDNYERDSIKQYQNKKSTSLNNKSLTSETFLPVLTNSKNPNLCLNQNKLFTTKRNKKIDILKDDKFYDLYDTSLTIRDPLTTEVKRQKNKDYLKYCNEYRNQRYYHRKNYDKKNNSVIRRGDMDKGIYDMICKKLIPKTADITPAMDLGGNPLNICKKNRLKSKNINKLYSKEEIITGPLNKFKYNQFDMEEVYNVRKKLMPISRDWGIRQKRTIPYYHETISDTLVSNTTKTSIINESSNKSNIFITRSNQASNTIQDNTNNKTNNISEIKSKTNNNNMSMFLNTSATTKSKTVNNNSSINNAFDSSKLKTEYADCFSDYISELDTSDSLVLFFENYKIIKDNNYNQFKNKNSNKWHEIENILNNIGTLFQKLNILFARVDSKKIIYLLKFYDNEIQNIINKDLLECLTDEDLKEKGLDLRNEMQLYKKVKEAFIIRIQKIIRKKLAYNRYQFLKIMNVNIIFLQKNYRMFITKKKIKKLLEEERKNIHDKFLKILNEFKSNWKYIQNSTRVEIHFYSISRDTYHNCLIDKFTMKESLQLNRLIRLVDPKIEIIYILPFQISDEILTYYFSLLESIGVKNIENRLHLIVPDATDYIPSNYSLAKLLYLSPLSIIEIKELIKDKEAYIVPGIISSLEESISYLLEKPIFMGNKDQIDLIFNKSGIKSAFELNDISFPISAWDIKTEEEFYSSLAHLIVTYPAIQVWIFKCNLDSNGRGIAYLDTSNIDIINEFKYENKTNPEFTNLIFEEKLYNELKNILIRNANYAYPNLYTNWSEFIKKFLKEKGIIENCPTKNLDGIISSPCLPIFIEPNGKILILPSFEKINVDYFKNIACTSPQTYLNNGQLNKIGEQIGNFLFSQGIIGYTTLEFITYHDGKKILYSGVDMKYGLTQQICDLQFCYILYVQSSLIKNNKNYFNIFLSENIKEESEESSRNQINEESETNSDINNKENCSYIIDNKTYSDILSDTMVFTFPHISSEYLRGIKLKEFLKEFRYSNIIFDMDKKEGIIFNLCDGLECGIFGLCGIINLDTLEKIFPNLKLWKLINKAFMIFKDYIYKKEKKNILNILNKGLLEKNRNDQIEIHSIINKVKIILKEKEIEQQNEEKRRKIIANTTYI